MGERFDRVYGKHFLPFSFVVKGMGFAAENEANALILFTSNHS